MFPDGFIRDLIRACPPIEVALNGEVHASDAAADYLDTSIEIVQSLPSKIDSQPVDCLIKLWRHMLTLTSGCLLAMISQNSFSLLVQLRQLYEAHIVLLFIAKHTGLAQPFVDHRWVSQYHLNLAFDLEPPSENLKSKYDEVVMKYGRTFKSDYGWASPVFPQTKRPRLLDLVRDLQLEHVSSIYRLGSDVVHSNSFFVDAEPEFNDVLGTAGFAITEFLCTSLSDAMESIGVADVDRILTCSLLQALRETLPGADD